MKQIQVGVDGSEASLDALRWAARLASSIGADVTAVRAYLPSGAETAPADFDALLDRAEQQLRDWCSGVTTEAVHTVVVPGGPDTLLAASEQSADLLVVGTRGAGGFPHLHLGSVAHHLSHHTSIPLATVPASASSEHVGRIVVAVDGSRASAAAVQLCSSIAPKLGSEVVAVYAYDPIVEWVPATDPHSWYSAAQRNVHEWVAAIEDAGVRVSVRVERDIHPVAALCHEIEKQSDTLAVVGARGLGGFSGMRLGRVPIHLVHHTGAVVVIVPELLQTEEPGRR